MTSLIRIYDLIGLMYVRFDDLLHRLLVPENFQEEQDQTRCGSERKQDKRAGEFLKTHSSYLVGLFNADRFRRVPVAPHPLHAAVLVHSSHTETYFKRFLS